MSLPVTLSTVKTETYQMLKILHKIQLSKLHFLLENIPRLSLDRRQWNEEERKL